jgi:hypothetical protein
MKVLFEKKRPIADVAGNLSFFVDVSSTRVLSAVCAG